MYRNIVWLTNSTFPNDQNQPVDELTLEIDCLFVNWDEAYSEVPNTRADRNKQAGWHFLKKL